MLGCGFTVGIVWICRGLRGFESVWVWVWCGDQHWAMGLWWVLFGLPWVACVRIGMGHRCLGVLWRSALGCGFVVGFVWVCRVWMWCGEGGVDGVSCVSCSSGGHVVIVVLVKFVFVVEQKE